MSLPYLFGPITREEADGWIFVLAPAHSFCHDIAELRLGFEARFYLCERLMHSRFHRTALFKANNAVNGNYLIRERGEGESGEFVLGVMFKGKATHHLLKPDGAGNYLVNNRAMGTNTTLQQVGLSKN